MAETSYGPVARSPVAPPDPVVVTAGWLVSARRSTAELTLVDLTPLAKVAVRAEPDGATARELPAPGRAARVRVPGLGTDPLATCAAPGEWLVLAGPGERDPVVAWVRATPSEGPVSVVDLTHGRALFRLTGPRAADLLARECALDLGDRGCPDQRALRTAVSGLAVDVVRDDRPGVPSYLLHCERSSGQYLFDTLLDAGAEFGIDVDGFPPPESTTS